MLLYFFVAWAETKSTWYIGQYWPTVSAPMIYEYGKFGGMRIVRGN
jgi:hypothetical protein